MNDSVYKKIEGHFDGVFDGYICGWVRWLVGGAPVPLLIIVDGRQAARIEARAYREDLAEIGDTGGYCSFRYPVHDIISSAHLNVLDGQEHEISIIVDDDSGRGLIGSPQRVIFGKFNFQGSKIPLDMQLSVMQVSGGVSNFVGLGDSNKPVAIVSTYTDGSFYIDYHKELFLSLRAQGFFVLAIHTSNQPKHFDADGAISDFGVDLCIVRSNLAYDFGSYMIGLSMLYQYRLQERDVLLVNDSSFGPVGGLSDMFAKMANQDYDFWGVVDSYEHKYHLQSFFILLGRRVMGSAEFEQYVHSYSYPSDKSEVIQKGELGLTPFLYSHGFSGGVAYPYEEVLELWISKYGIESKEGEAEFISNVRSYVKNGVALNPMHFFWDVLLEDLGCPFVKRELIFKNLIGHPDAWAVVGKINSMGYDYKKIRQAASVSGGAVKVWPRALPKQRPRVKSKISAVKNQE